METCSRKLAMEKSYVTKLHYALLRGKTAAIAPTARTGGCSLNADIFRHRSDPCRRIRSWTFGGFMVHIHTSAAYIEQERSGTGENWENSQNILANGTVVIMFRNFCCETEIEMKQRTDPTGSTLAGIGWFGWGNLYLHPYVGCTSSFRDI